MHAPGLISFVLSTLLTPSSLALASEPYCLALRGNGETEPAHWGALANVLEKLGLPRAQAGGSSAAISLLLLDGIAANPVLNSPDLAIQKKRSSLAIKSMMGVTNSVMKRPEVQAGTLLYKSYGEGPFAVLKLFAGKIWQGEFTQYIKDLLQLGRELFQNGVGKSPRYAFLVDLFFHPRSLRDASWDKWQRAPFYIQEIWNALGTIGAFDAESDGELFFRDGLVDFQAMGAGFGKLATFYSGTAWDSDTRQNFLEFLKICEKIHGGKTWDELVTAEPRCQSLLNASLDAFFKQNLDWDRLNVVFKKAGFAIPSLLTTAVILGESAKETRRFYEEYHARRDRHVAQKFKIQNTKEVVFGYWGPPNALEKIRSRLKTPFKDRLGRFFDFTQDAKSVRFKSLGPTTWSEVMRLSPAEPGLTALQRMSVDGQEAYSAGGWSDLHPIPVLKALGCDQVLYVTRKGGESLFGQGVGKRVFNFDRSWDVLRNLKPDDVLKNNRINNAGDPTDLTSPWSLLYNVANPKSSYMRAVAAADAVLCTDWNRYNIKTEFVALVEQSYHSPYVAGKAFSPLEKQLKENGANFVANPFASTDGQPDWSGCHPPE